MISYISGLLTEIADKYVVVEASGVGYEIIMPGMMIGKLPPEGSSVKIYTHLHISEDARKLYGFISPVEREIFRLLIGVNGVGPKAAISVLSILTPDELRFAILSDDVKKISAAQGLGEKTAKKIILELKDKFDKEDTYVELESKDSTPNTNREEAIEALKSLGCSASKAISAVSKIEDIANKDASEIMSEALRILYNN